MSTLKLDRMRRHKDRDREHSDAQLRRRWLASLTPEHRAVHERGMPCGDCSRAALEQLGRRLTIAMGGK